MFKDAIDQMKDDEYIDQLEQQNKRYKQTIKEIKNESEWMIELSEHGHKFESIKNRCDEALEGDKE